MSKPKALCQNGCHYSKNPSKAMPTLGRIPRILLYVQDTLRDHVLGLGAILNLMLEAVSAHVSFEFLRISLEGGSCVERGEDVP